MYYLALIIVLSNNVFWLVPRDVPVKTYDIGLILIFLGLAYQIFIKRIDLAPFARNPFTWLFLGFLFLVLIQVPLAGVVYQQSLFDGLVSVRYYSYFLTFFLFATILKTPQDVVRLLNILCVFGVICCGLGTLDYFIGNIFHTSLGEGMNFRSGFGRAQIPGMEIISIALLWQAAQWAYPLNSASRVWNWFFTFLFSLSMIFRQGRVRLFSMIFAVIYLLIIRRKFKVLLWMGALGFTGIVALTTLTEINLVANLWTTAVEDTIEVQGTAKARQEMIELDFEIFNDYPFIGGGSLAIRVKDDTSSKLQAIAYSMDLGYTHLLKHLGIIGVAWLAAFYLTFMYYAHRIRETLPSRYMAISAFCSSYFVFFIVSFVTLSHLFFVYVIPLVTMICAFLMICSRGDNERLREIEK